MISSIVALLAEIVPSPAVAPVSVLSDTELYAPRPDAASLDYGVSVLVEPAPVQVAEDQDRRQLLIGYWNCVGKKTASGKPDEPYHGHMHNLWTLDKSWLLLQFKEYQPAQAQPFAEEQYWGIDPVSGAQTRPMMTSTNGFALVTASGWQDNTLRWTGTYLLAGTTFDLTETIVMLSHNKLLWTGEVIYGGTAVAGYELTCTRSSKGQNTAMPTV
jgi:hypothetical protein